MSRMIYARILVAGALLAGAAGCSLTDGPPLGRLTLSNYRFDSAAVEAMLTAAPDCTAPDPSMAVTAFELPFKGTRVIEAAPATDICWRRKVAGSPWTDWNRAYTATGRVIDSQL
jgi:hypothetical protein